MAKKSDRVIIYLSCNQCGERSYTTAKNKKNDPQKMELRKFCSRCRAHTLHREVK